MAPNVPVQAGQHRGHGDATDTQAAVGGGTQRTAGVESEPAEREDEASDQDRGDVMSDDRVGRAVAVELAEARTHDQAHGQGSESAD